MNTGRLIYKTLVEVDEETGLPTGNVKANAEGDPDYVAPQAIAFGSCPIQFNQFGKGLVFITQAEEIDLSEIIDMNLVELIIWGDGLITERDYSSHTYEDDSSKVVFIQTLSNEVQVTNDPSIIMQLIYKSTNIWLQD